MKNQPESKLPTVGNLPASPLSLHPLRGEGRGEGSVQKSLIGAKATHRNAPERVGVIKSITAGYAWLEYTSENEAGQAPTVSLAHYALTELNLL